MRALSDELLSRAQSGDRSARDEIFESNTGLIWACVRKYAGVLEKDDLYQMGSIGLLKAIDRFDPTYGVAFSTFAVPHILGEVRRHLRDNALVKVDRRLREIAFRVNKTRELLFAQTGAEPPVSQVAKELDLPVDVVLEAMEAAASVVYLEDVPAHREAQVPVDRPGTDETMDLREALGRLEPQMRAVVEGRFFSGKTQQEVSRELGISQAHVSRLEKKAILAMREYYRGR
ncbi:MAG: sigma-70 family RNA polymerase sigma factor [Bacillota bacterium]